MTDRQRLQLIEHLVSGDFAGDIEWTLLKKRGFTPEQAREMADLLGKIFTLVHPAVSRCQHPVWEKENEKMLNEMKKDI